MADLIVDSVKVTAKRGQQVLVDTCSFTLSRGELMSVIGPNGAGKSTLLNAIAGDNDHTGKITFPNFSPESAGRARQLAVLPQHSLLRFPFEVQDVVALGRIPHATGFDVDQSIVERALTQFDINYLTGRSYTDLSGGEKQRVQLARVMAQIWREEDAANGSRVLLLDEPTAALDLGHQHDLMRSLKKFAEQGVAVLMILHDMNLASRYSDKILAMLCSQSVAFGTPEEIITEQLVHRLFQTDVQIQAHPENGKPMVFAL